MEERQDLYEVTVILKEGSDFDAILKTIAEHGEIKKSLLLGVRQFAYPIGKLTSGNYAAVEFVSGTDKIREIDTMLKAEKSVIRFIITKAIRKGPEPIRSGEWAEKKESKVSLPEGGDEKKVAESAENTPEAIMPTETKEAEPTQPETTQEELSSIEVPVEEPAKETEPVQEPKATAKKTAVKKPRAKAEKVSAEELDKKLEELVKE